ncbi:MAG: mobilization protein, partial [Planktothrix sp.]
MAGRSRRTKSQLEQVDPTTEQAEALGEVSMTVTLKSPSHLGENGLETVEKHATRIHLIDGEKGGV